MNSPRVYLDHNAGAPLRPAAREAMLEALGVVGNASSVHAEGREAHRRIETAREEVAALVGAKPAGVVFTASGSEAAATALSPEMVVDGRPRHYDVLLVSAVEHACVLAGGRFPAEAVEVIGVDACGIVDLGALEARLGEHAAAGRRAIVAVQAANNETGVLQPVSTAAGIARRFGALTVCDAVQVAGRIPLSMADIGCDVLILSAHKLGGPQGAGAMVLADEHTHAVPLIRGGGQERRLRAGTENVAAIVGFGVAAREAAGETADNGRMVALRRQIEADVLSVAPTAHIFGLGAARLPNTVSFAVPGLTAETVVIAFDLAGVAISAGSACSSGKVAPSHVVRAMGAGPELARGAVRVSLGWCSREADVARFAAVWRSVYTNLRRGAGLAA